MEEALRSILAADAGVTALVSSRLYWGLAPQSVTGDFVAMYVVSGNRDYHMSAASGLRETRVQFDCWASSYGAAKTIARAVESALSGFSGSQSGKALRGVFVNSERDDNESDTADTASRYRTSLDLIIWHD